MLQQFRLAAQAVAGAVLTFAALSVAGQSTRPGWGSTPYAGGVTFRVWAPNATNVTVPGQFNSWSTTATPLAKEYSNSVWTGVWSADVPGAVNLQQYKYYIGYNGQNIWKHDPRARMVVAADDNAGDNDIIYDPTVFNWQGDNFTTPPLSNMVVYELHVGVFEDPRGKNFSGRFFDVTNGLPYLKILGVGAIELLPIAEFPPSPNWGYEPSDPYAADNYEYGGPDGLKTLVRTAHQYGIAVFLDVVHNHYGPTDLDLWDFDGYAGCCNGGGIYFYPSNGICCTTYGSRPNFTTQQCRDYIQENFEQWLDEYHVDGFRWDTPGLMMNASGYGFIPDAASLIESITGMIASDYPGKIDIAEDVTGMGFNSSWDTQLPGELTPQLAYVNDTSRDMYTIESAIFESPTYNEAATLGRVDFLESHDVVGDLNNGTRLVTAISSTAPAGYRARKLSTLGAAIIMTSPGVPMFFEGQEMLENKQFSTGTLVDWTKTNTYAGIVKLYSDLIHLRRNYYGDTAGLEASQSGALNVDNSVKLIAFHRYANSAPGNDVVIVANFSTNNISNYTINFPEAGTWYAHFNSDSTSYSPDFGNVGSTVVTASGSSPTAPVTIGRYSAIIFSQQAFPPSLAVGCDNGDVNISWPVAFSSWTLDTSPALDPAAWTPAPRSQYLTNAANVSLTVAPGATAFYRLREF